MATQLILVEDENGEEIVETVSFCLDAIYLGTTFQEEFKLKDKAEYTVPTGILDALKGNHNNKWTPSAASEVMNFISRNCWKKVPRSLPELLDRKIMKTLWAFQVKDKHDGTLRYKFRVCSKGDEQIPGVDFTESFALVATNTTVCTTLFIYLFYAQEGRDGLTFVCEMIDISAAFLEGDMDRYGVCNSGGLEGVLPTAIEEHVRKS